jgi:hypothetical protein
MVQSRDVKWLNQVYGEWKGLKTPNITRLPSPEDAPSIPEEAEPPKEETPEEPQEAARPARLSRELRALTADLPVDESLRDRNERVTRSMQRATEELNAETQAEEAGTTSLYMSAMMDRLDFDFGFASAGSFVTEDTEDTDTISDASWSQIKPEEYKDRFDNPAKFDEAWDHPESHQRSLWRAAINKEFAKMERCKVWKKVKRTAVPTGRRCVKHKWVFEIKRNGVFRARLVACGYSQVGGQDFEDTFSPVVHDVTFRIWLIMVMLWQLPTLIFDIETAFLHGELEGTEIYMDCPEGMEHEDDECLQLLKTIYGLVQAARQYFRKFADVMKSIGFVQSPADPCMFVKRDHLGTVVVIVYVDDCAACGHRAALDDMLKRIKESGFNLTVNEDMQDYLSCEVSFNKDRTRAWLGQPHMIKKIRKTFGEDVKGLPKYKTPGTPGVGLIRAEEDEALASPEEQKLYRSGVGMLLYLVKHSRPDLGNPVRELTKCLIGAHPAAMKEMYRVIKFVLDTSNLGLKIEPVLEGEDKLKWKLVGYSDSDWAGDRDNRKSVSGFILFLCGVPIMWRSKQQATVALSSAEAEFVSVGELVKEVSFVVQLLLSMEIAVQMPVVIRVDNMGAIFMSKNASSSGRTRHMDVKWRFINDLVNDEVIQLVFVKSGENWSDMETKNVSSDIYETHVVRFLTDKKDL